MPPGRLGMKGGCKMKQMIFAVLAFVTVAAMLTTPSPARAVYESSGPMAIEAPEHLTYIFGKGVYFVPGVDEDIFFFLGLWYQRAGGRWFDSPGIRGAWTELPLANVPRPLMEMPIDFRTVFDRYGDVPYRYVVRSEDREYDYSVPYVYPYGYPAYCFEPRFRMGIYGNGGPRYYRLDGIYYYDPRYYRYGYGCEGHRRGKPGYGGRLPLEGGRRRIRY